MPGLLLPWCDDYDASCISRSLPHLHCPPRKHVPLRLCTCYELVGRRSTILLVHSQKSKCFSLVSDFSACYSSLDCLRLACLLTLDALIDLIILSRRERRNEAKGFLVSSIFTLDRILR